MTKTIELKRLSIDLNEDWSQYFTKGWNWITFHLIGLEWEKEYIHGSSEVVAYLLGFGIRIYWTWNKEMLEEKMKEYEDKVKNGKWKVF